VKPLDYEHISVGPEPRRALVILHGWQGNKFSLKQLKFSLNLKSADYYFPSAPYLVGQDDARRSWSLEVQPGVWEMRKSREGLEALFQEVIFTRYASRDVFVLGFSQGALTCYELILKLEKPLGGVFPIAGFLRDPQSEALLFHPQQRMTPIFIGHGEQDKTVLPAASMTAYEKLKAQGANVRLFPFNGGHKISLEYIHAVKKIILQEQSLDFND